MDRKQQIVIGAVSMVLTVLVVAAVTASSSEADTPLYTVRMEQASSKMSFLPTEVNGFFYQTEKGCTIKCTGSGCSSVQPLDTGVWTCIGSTCGGDTCVLTCPESCYGTCNDPTCPDTCNTTCNDPTCVFTCGDTHQNTCSTCEETCEHTCPVTCDDITCLRTCSGDTCWHSCDVTCEVTCDCPECSP